LDGSIVKDEQPDETTGYRLDATHQRSGKATVLLVAVFAIGVALYFALGMPGMNHGTASEMNGMDMTSESSPARLVDPATFAAAREQPGAVVINVHVPYAGELERTDLFMPFDQIDVALLPENRNSPLLIYCESGSMSAQAATTLTSLGFTNVVELNGGMQAWRASGRSVTLKR
jgi:rhodanese-related sulfurtransferase